MVGIVVDSQRMHVTKEHWIGLLDILSEIVGKPLHELHTRDFYAGSGVWYKMKGSRRSQVITAIFNWLADRKHHLVYSSTVKTEYFSRLKSGIIPKELNTLWRFLGFHLILSMQKKFQREEKNKGNTIFVFDNEERQQVRFTDLIMNPPSWSDTYCNKKRKQNRLDQIVDVPYFGDSKEVALIQVADFFSFFLRSYAEIKEGLVPPKYTDEQVKIESWAKIISEHTIGRSMIYPSKQRCTCANIFFVCAPESIRKL